MAGRGAPIGNNNAANHKRWLAAIERAVEAWPNEPDNTDCSDLIKGLNLAAHKFVANMMAEGNINFFKEFGDRLDGKAAQSVQLSSDPENPLKVNHTHTMATEAISLLSKIRGTEEPAK